MDFLIEYEDCPWIRAKILSQALVLSSFCLISWPFSFQKIICVKVSLFFTPRIWSRFSLVWIRIGFWHDDFRHFLKLEYSYSKCQHFRSKNCLAFWTWHAFRWCWVIAMKKCIPNMVILFVEIFKGAVYKIR